VVHSLETARRGDATGRHRPVRVGPAPASVIDTSTISILVLSAILICASSTLTMLSMIGLGELVPTTVRVPLVVLSAVTLPGLPIASWLSLPRNGIFASVGVALSLASTLLMSQLSNVAGLHHPFAVQFLILGMATVPTVLLAKRWRRQPSVLGTSPGRGFLVGVRASFVRASGYSIAMLAVSVALFVAGVSDLDTGRSGATGLIGILGIKCIAGFALLCVVLALEYSRTVIDKAMLAVSNVMLVMYMTMPVAWSDRMAPFSTAYVHRYIADWIFDIGALPPPVDARISWGGFFSGAAQLMSIAALNDSAVFVTSASFFFGVLLIFPVYAIALALSGNARTAWLGVTVFVLFNWYQQDYFAPQAVAMQLYVTILAVLIWQLRAAQLPALRGRRFAGLMRAWSRLPGRVPGTDARWSLAMEAVLVALVAAMVVSHQLTPLVTIGALLSMSVLGVTRLKLLWLAALLIFVAWFTYGASAYWQGHLGEVLHELGGVRSSLGVGVSNRIAGDPVYGHMQLLRIAAGAFLFVMAAVGWYRIRRTKFWPIAAALALQPFTLVLVQSYGGEVVIRCFLYASPVLAPLAAIALRSVLPLGTRARERRLGLTLVTGVLLLILGLWGLTNRGLNTSFEHTDQAELAVSEQLAKQVDPGSIAYWGQGTLLGLPRGHDVGATCIEAGRDLADCTAAEDASYLIVTRQDEKLLEYRYRVDHDEVARAIDRLVSFYAFTSVYRSELVSVLMRTGARPVPLGIPR
jgi:hypothetical protein